MKFLSAIRSCDSEQRDPQDDTVKQTDGRANHPDPDCDKMSMQPPTIRGYRFGGFTLDLARRRLSGPGQEPIVLSGRAFDVLAHLLTCRERMVPKRELMDIVWPHMAVEENNLTQAISTLRRVLGDSREAPRFIATIAGRGYQFVGDTSPIPSADEVGSIQRADDTVSPDVTLERAARSPAAASTPAGQMSPAKPLSDHPTSGPVATAESISVSRRLLLGGAGAVAVAIAAGAGWELFRRKPASGVPASIAVLPFKPLLSTPRNEAIEIGVAELLINRLSTLPGVIVKPLSSVRRYSAPEQDPLQAGRDLGVVAVVDGYVQIQQGDVRLTARLLDVATGQSLWAGNFTDKLSDFFAVQDSLVTQLVSALAVDVPIDARERLLQRSTVDTEAWQLYANGRYQIERRTPDGVQRAREFFQAAIARDPRFALAITGLSEAWALSGTFALIPPRQAFESARAAAQRALEIDPKLPSALVALGHVKTQLDHDWAAGRRLYLEALALAPNAAWTHSFLALIEIQSGSAVNALDYIGRAQALEPAAVPIMAIGGFVHYQARQLDAARRQLGAVLDAVPGAVLARQFLARVVLAQGDGRTAVALLEGRNAAAPGSYSTLGRAYALVGNESGARRELAFAVSEGEKGFGVGFDVALLHLALDERDLAFAALERAVDDGSQMIGYINVDPALDSIRGEPRVRAVARRIGLA